MFVEVCRSPNGELYADVFRGDIAKVSFRSSVQFLYTYICSQAPGVTKTLTSIYEVSFPLEENMGNNCIFVSF